MRIFGSVPGRNFWYRAGYRLTRWVARTFFFFEAQHAERIPATGGVILAMNHQSFLDPPLAGLCAQRPLYFLARKTLLKIPLIGPILPKVNVIPVDRGGNDMSAMKAVIRILKEGEGTIVFPEGTRTHDGDLQPVQAGLGMIIAKTLVPVVPMRVFGAFEAFPRTAKFPRRRRVTIVVGEPITFTEADLGGGGREVYQRLSERVMERIAGLRLEERPLAAANPRGERGWWGALGLTLVLAMIWLACATSAQEKARFSLETMTPNQAVFDTAFFPIGEVIPQKQILVTFGGQPYCADGSPHDESSSDMRREGADETGRYVLYRQLGKKKDHPQQLFLKVAPERFLPVAPK